MTWQQQQLLQQQEEAREGHGTRGGPPSTDSIGQICGAASHHSMPFLGWETSVDWWQRIILQTCDNLQGQKIFRVRKVTFLEICAKLTLEL